MTSSPDSTGLEWTSLVQTGLEVTDTDVVTCSLPAASARPTGLEKLTVSPTGSVASKRKASSSALGITELVALLETADLAQPGPQRLLLSVVYTLRKAPGPVVMSALAGDIGKQLVQVLALKHREHASMMSISSHLIVACYLEMTTAGDRALQSENTVQDTVASFDHLASSPQALEVLLGHLVLAAVQPQALFKQRGLVTAMRSLQTLFLLQTRGLPHSKAVQQMCVAADLPGRMLQVLGLSPDKYLPSPHEPWDAPKGSSCGEVYLQFLGAACTYVSYSSGIFNAPGGQMTLDAASIAKSSEWLLAPGRLEALRQGMETLEKALYDNKRQEHVECADTRHIESALKNIVTLLTLPLCCSKRPEDVVQLVTFSLRYLSRLYRLNYPPLFKRMLDVSHPSQGSHAAYSAGGRTGSSNGTDTNGASTSLGGSTETERPTYYQHGAYQEYFAATAGVMCDAMLTVGASVPEVDTADKVEAHSATIQELIKLQLPRIVVWSDLLMSAIQQSQKVPSEARGVMEYRRATMLQPPQEDDKATESSASSLRRCAQCGLRSERLLTCQRCKVACYCGKDCQVAHWGQLHKLQCKHLQARQSEATGTV